MQQLVKSSVGSFARHGFDVVKRIVISDLPYKYFDEAYAQLELSRLRWKVPPFIYAMAFSAISLSAVQAAQAFACDAAGIPVGAVAVNLQGTFSATVVFEATTDNSNWFAVAAYPVLASGVLGGAVLSTTAIGQFVIPVFGYASVRVRVSAYTSGTVTGGMDASGSGSINSFVNTEGQKPTYSAGLGGNTPAATPTDLAIYGGTASKVQRITRTVVTVSATASGVNRYDWVKRVAGTQSAVNTAFVAGTHQSKYDSADAVSAMITAGLAGLYTSNPASTGTLAGVISPNTITILANSTVRIEDVYGPRPSRCPTIRAANEFYALSGAGHTLLTGEVFGVVAEWTEE